LVDGSARPDSRWWWSLKHVDVRQQVRFTGWCQQQVENVAADVGGSVDVLKQIVALQYVD